MVIALKQTGQLKESKLYDLDWDNQIQPTEKCNTVKPRKWFMNTRRGSPPLPIPRRDRLCLCELKAEMAIASQNTFRPTRFQGIYQPQEKRNKDREVQGGFGFLPERRG